ncbi:hypothetical protein, partial [Escherichia coli]|uniref:hypothetical protein n=2 Tax=Enterobacteriaceae TaxID=543 RepID=UPI0019541AF7
PKYTRIAQTGTLAAARPRNVTARFMPSIVSPTSIGGAKSKITWRGVGERRAFFVPLNTRLQEFLLCLLSGFR